MGSIYRHATTAPIDSSEQAGTGLKGHRSDLALRASFPFSPLWPATDAVFTEEYMKRIGITALNGNGSEEVKGEGSLGTAAGTVSDGGYMFSSFNLNYRHVDNPDVPNLDIAGPAGAPASPHIPNLSSAPQALPSQMREYDPAALPVAGVEVGSGIGGLASPAETSAGIANQTIGDLLVGRSYIGSKGE
jgi:hypothetical protein